MKINRSFTGKFTVQKRDILELCNTVQNGHHFILAQKSG